MARIGVFLCHCGSNIAGSVNIKQVMDSVKNLPHVVYVEDNKFTCSEPGQASIRNAIKEHRLNRVVIAACSPRMHEVTFRKTVVSAGLNPYLLEIANLREHCSWVHPNQIEAATEKAIDLVKKAIARVVWQEPLVPKKIGVTKRALVIGGGIAGIQTSMDIANAGYEVILVEREPSIGGRMAQLDKTFPTLDCSACILTPKMTNVGQHEKIHLMSYSEVESVSGFVGNFTVKIKQKARYVDLSKCTSCNDCTKVCPVDTVSKFNENLDTHKAIFIPFPQAIPNKYIIEKKGTPPCRAACPAGVNAQGYIAMISQKKYKEAIAIVREAMPFVAVCGRVCHHFCESDCERANVDEPIAIHSLKRFIADYEIQHSNEPVSRFSITKDSKIAVIGSGPAGLTCAYDLVKMGYPVTVFESTAKAGGLLRWGIPEHRLPNSVLDKDIDFIVQKGVEIEFNHPIDNIEKLLEQGFEAVFLATGTPKSMDMGIKGEDTPGVMHALSFLHEVNGDSKIKLGKKVAVVGGGNAAIDAARVAWRLGAEEVSILYRRTIEEMPVLASEVEEAFREGIKFNFLVAPVEVISKDYRIDGVKCIRMQLGEPDKSGRRRPVPIEGSEFIISLDNLIIAIGQKIEKDKLPDKIEITSGGTVLVDPITLETNIPGIFAGGDIVSNPSGVIEVIGTGKEAAISIDRYLNGMDLHINRPKSIVKVKDVQKEGVVKKERAKMPELDVVHRTGSFQEVELGFDEETALAEADRCLSCAICSECHECEKVCEPKAIDYDMQDEIVEEKVGAIVLATGIDVLDHKQVSVYGGGLFPDVISSLQMERMMNAAGPTAGEVVRPSDGKHPKQIVFIGCVGSRDNVTGKGYCAKVCCMYMAKHAVMLHEHDEDVHSYIIYPDVRGPGGKIFEEFIDKAESIGTTYLRMQIEKVDRIDNVLTIIGKDLLSNEEIKIPTDMVVLAMGLWPSEGVSELAQKLNISYDDKNFMVQAHVKLRPTETSTDGVFLAGCVIAPTDIPESVVQGGAAAEYVLKLFSHDIIDGEPMTSFVDNSRCSGCQLCIQVCPYTAIETNTLRDGRIVASINETLCKGCGICVSACRPKAIVLKGFNDQELLAEVMAL